MMFTVCLVTTKPFTIILGYVTVGLIGTGPLACLSPFAIKSVDKSHLLCLQVSKLPYSPVVGPLPTHAGR